MTNEEVMEQLEQLRKMVEEDDRKFVIGIDPAGKDGDESVVTFKVTKSRESEDGSEFVWADGQSLSPEERMAKIAADSVQELPLTHELTDEQLDAEMCAVGSAPERRQEVLDEIKLRAMRKGMEKVNEELAAELDESEREDLKNMAKWKRAAEREEGDTLKSRPGKKMTKEEKDEEGRRKEEEAMGTRKAREDGLAEIWKARDRARDKERSAKNNAFLAIARNAMKEKKGYGGNF